MNAATPSPEKGASGLTPEAVTAAFVPCGRCSFFLSGYRLIHDDFKQAVAESQDRRLRLSGGRDTRLLLHKTFGIRLDVASYRYERLCPECQRRYVYESGADDSPDTLLVAVEAGR
ncbi:MAG: hypothetical protein R3300_05865 [Candidatus Promineifilaceae bacterium]|nr:hypothetical protein [Candidatus Promineifilaceae bacterium]